MQYVLDFAVDATWFALIASCTIAPFIYAWNRAQPAAKPVLQPVQEIAVEAPQPATEAAEPEFEAEAVLTSTEAANPELELRSIDAELAVAIEATEPVDVQTCIQAEAPAPIKRKRGRPKGSKNKRRAA